MTGQQIPTKINGIPCLVKVTSFFYQPPSGRSPLRCSDPTELYGDYECEFEVLDRKGYRADWLSEKITSKDYERIEGEILDAYLNTDWPR